MRQLNGRFKTQVILAFNIFTALKELIHICNNIDRIIHRTYIKIYINNVKNEPMFVIQTRKTLDNSLSHFGLSKKGKIIFIVNI